MFRNQYLGYRRNFDMTSSKRLQNKFYPNNGKYLLSKKPALEEERG